MDQDRKTQGGRNEAPDGRGGSRGVTPGSVESFRDLANLNLSVGLGVLRGDVGTREANTATGCFREVRRTVVEGQRIGYEKRVLDHRPALGDDHLLRREAELTAELEAIRERRGA